MDFTFVTNYTYWLMVLLIMPVSFIQNMAFTAVSRSRNAGDPSYHRRCAYASNGIYILCQFFIWSRVWPAFNTGNYIELLPVAIIYVLSTAEGSVFMMKRLLRTETGMRKVGASSEH